METWAEINRRHRQEKADALSNLADTYTQTEAAKMMGMERSQLNNYVMRYGIEWPTKSQGCGEEVDRRRAELQAAGSLIAKQYQRGKTLCELSKQYKTCRKTIRKLVVSNGVEVRSCGAKPQPKVEAPEKPAAPHTPALPAWAQ